MGQELTRALDRAEQVLTRRPRAAQHDDAPGIARWTEGLRVVTRHLNGRQVETDMPVELGGTGDEVSPGWMVRAGLAACTATSVAMAAAREGVTLDALEVEATSRSDTRGVLGLCSEDGAPIYAGPRDLAMRVRIAAAGVSPERLRALVERAGRSSPMLMALRDAAAVPMQVDVA